MRLLSCPSHILIDSLFAMSAMTCSFDRRETETRIECWNLSFSIYDLMFLKR